jgi:hypothetical protein
MAATIDMRAGGYRYIPFAFQYSGGVAALDGFRIERVTFSERQIYEAAMDRLAAELAALDKTDKATASEKLANFLKTIV